MRTLLVLLAAYFCNSQAVPWSQTPVAPQGQALGSLGFGSNTDQNIPLSQMGFGRQLDGSRESAIFLDQAELERLRVQSSILRQHGSTNSFWHNERRPLVFAPLSTTQSLLGVNKPTHCVGGGKGYVQMRNNPTSGGYSGDVVPHLDPEHSDQSLYTFTIVGKPAYGMAVSSVGGFATSNQITCGTGTVEIHPDFSYAISIVSGYRQIQTFDDTTTRDFTRCGYRYIAANHTLIQAPPTIPSAVRCAITWVDYRYDFGIVTKYTAPITILSPFRGAAVVY